jgi:hypothetical protein
VVFVEFVTPMRRSVNTKPNSVLVIMLTMMLISVCTLSVAEQVSGVTTRTASDTLGQSSTSSSITCAVANWLFDTAGGHRLRDRLTPIISRAKDMFTPNVAVTPVRVRLAVFSSVPAHASAENGVIAPGDLLVAAPQPGYVMRAPVHPTPRAIIGTARGWLVCGTGVIAIQETLR